MTLKKKYGKPCRFVRKVREYVLATHKTLKFNINRKSCGVNRKVPVEEQWCKKVKKPGTYYKAGVSKRIIEKSDYRHLENYVRFNFLQNGLIDKPSYKQQVLTSSKGKRVCHYMTGIFPESRFTNNNILYSDRFLRLSEPGDYKDDRSLWLDNFLIDFALEKIKEEFDSDITVWSWHDGTCMIPHLT